MARLHILWLLLGLVVAVSAQSKMTPGVPDEVSQFRPKPMPRNTPPLRVIERSVLPSGHFHPASGRPAVRLYDASDLSGFYLPTADEICEDVPLLGPACIRRVAIAYYAPDIDGDGQASQAINLTLTFRSWDDRECSPAGSPFQVFNVSGLYDNNAWLLILTIEPPVVVPGSFYLGTDWSDDRVGWIIVDGRPGNALHDRSLNSFWNASANGCYWFGGVPRANFYLRLWGSYDTVFRIGVETDSLRAAIDAGEFWRYALSPDTESASHWLFSIPVGVGQHVLFVETVPSFLPTTVTFETTSTDPCAPTIVDVPLLNGDLNGDGCVDDADLLTVLFNFGTGCEL